MRPKPLIRLTMTLLQQRPPPQRDVDENAIAQKKKKKKKTMYYMCMYTYAYAKSGIVVQPSRYAKVTIYFSIHCNDSNSNCENSLLEWAQVETEDYLQENGKGSALWTSSYINFTNHCLVFLCPNNTAANDIAMSLKLTSYNDTISSGSNHQSARFVFVLIMCMCVLFVRSVVVASQNPDSTSNSKLITKNVLLTIIIVSCGTFVLLVAGAVVGYFWYFKANQQAVIDYNNQHKNIEVIPETKKVTNSGTKKSAKKKYTDEKRSKGDQEIEGKSPTTTDETSTTM
ncbi:hypothetical protein RFI_10667 [Reticulomyxa filosa]|uniref:Uncharacterized protein n=1 Tax=Reticulomyxa filosa TaxID=46433 RepID=X6NKG2_RETFI|nr:hypothetical protein RFI_10667 [Reticulomyxa filosa]|eukprot:ETO26466.1 hypothetical protein RFI_10667 [Reticulomyxa filosa]